MTDHPVERSELEAALRFAHAMAAQDKARIAELSATVEALIEVLREGQLLDPSALHQKRRLTVLREDERAPNMLQFEIGAHGNKQQIAPVEIDCEARLELCGARCCSLPFALSREDLDEGLIRWDYARPYRIAQAADGSCIHCHEQRCSVYPNRPARCRLYDCRHDRRIWLDFDKRIPAP